MILGDQSNGYRTLVHMATITMDDANEAATALRAVLAEVDGGEMEAEPTEVAYLSGAADALEMVSRMAA